MKKRICKVSVNEIVDTAKDIRPIFRTIRQIQYTSQRRMDTRCVCAEIMRTAPGKPALFTCLNCMHARDIVIQ